MHLPWSLFVVLGCFVGGLLVCLGKDTPPQIAGQWNANFSSYFIVGHDEDDVDCSLEWFPGTIPPPSSVGIVYQMNVVNSTPGKPPSFNVTRAEIHKGGAEAFVIDDALRKVSYHWANGMSCFSQPLPSYYIPLLNWGWLQEPDTKTCGTGCWEGAIADTDRSIVKLCVNGSTPTRLYLVEDKKWMIYYHFYDWQNTPQDVKMFTPPPNCASSVTDDEKFDLIRPFVFPESIQQHLLNH